MTATLKDQSDLLAKKEDEVAQLRQSIADAQTELADINEFLSAPAGK